HFWWGTLFVVVFYFIVAFSVLVVRGPAMLSAPILPFEAFSAIDVALGRIPRNIAVIGFLAGCVFDVAFYTYSSARILMVAAIDKRLPLWFGRLNSNRVPANAVYFHIIFVLAVTFVTFIVSPAITNFGGNAINTMNDIYNVASASATLIWTIATMFFF